MATKIKKIYKGIKYITQIFVVKEEQEIEIGLPTDVKHIAHIGWDGASGNQPTWMNEFKAKPNKVPATTNVKVKAKPNKVPATTNVKVNIEETKSPNSPILTWSSQDFESMDNQPVTEMFDVTPNMDIPKKKKKKRKKSTSISSTNSTTRRVAIKSKTKLVIEGNARPDSIQVI
ncbi:CRIB domain-containing protein RIC10-like [Impatiens glandulifera]|uniref:CRIB domain-containing protein RIC10-like n=1 Tax=Impatiens glandulifera TaxID=253017 RepID=UPI001FB09CBD|nr:CRIB domain-containing protein RIC10-like [Impatiens glandulifera]XP_047332109.1 CRIB domain-containing protein RIC10-like [Impatiens glandulifera]